jgi:hypothetical protein
MLSFFFLGIKYTVASAAPKPTAGYVIGETIGNNTFRLYI